MGELLSIFVAAMLINNVVLIRFLGICPYLGVSQTLSSAVGMGIASIFVMIISSVVTWLIQHFILAQFGIEFLQTVTFVLVIASLVQFVEMFILKFSPSLYRALGVYLPLITTNCAIMGVALLNINAGYNLPETISHAFGAGAGFFLAIVLFAGLRERLARADVPRPLQGMPIALITAALMSMAFMGFAGFDMSLLLG